MLANSICPQQSHQNCEKKHFHMCKLPRRLLICAVLLWSRWRGRLPNPTNGIQIKDFIGLNCRYFFFPNRFRTDPLPLLFIYFFLIASICICTSHQMENGDWCQLPIPWCRGLGGRKGVRLGKTNSCWERFNLLTVPSTDASCLGQESATYFSIDDHCLEISRLIFFPFSFFFLMP